MLSTEEVVGRKVVDRAECDEEERLHSVRNSILVKLFYNFRDYRLFSGSNDKMKRCIMQLARLDDSVATVLTCLELGRSVVAYIESVPRRFHETCEEDGKHAYWIGSLILADLNI